MTCAPAAVFQRPGTRRSSASATPIPTPGAKRSATSWPATGSPSINTCGSPGAWTPRTPAISRKDSSPTRFRKSWLERYEPGKARFRTFVRVCADRFVMNMRQSSSRLKRGGGVQTLPLDFDGAEREVASRSLAVDARARRVLPPGVRPRALRQDGERSCAPSTKSGAARFPSPSSNATISLPPKA